MRGNELGRNTPTPLLDDYQLPLDHPELRPISCGRRASAFHADVRGFDRYRGCKGLEFRSQWERARIDREDSRAFALDRHLGRVTEEHADATSNPRDGFMLCFGRIA